VVRLKVLLDRTPAGVLGRREGLDIVGKQADERTLTATFFGRHGGEGELFPDLPRYDG
jgi:integrase